MKIIISHDVDHFSNREHINDLIIPKFFARSTIEFIVGSIDIKEFYLRFINIFQKKWHNIDHLIDFDRENFVPSTFFIAVEKGLGLNYSLKDAKFWINEILKNGFEVGLHGINFDNYKDIKRECEIFKDISKLNNFGIRMHYLRWSDNTLNILNDSGFIFDTTIYKIQNPYKFGEIWEFPLHIMDTYLFYKNCRWQNQSFNQAVDSTKKIVEKAYNKNIKYFTVLSHSRVFHDRFSHWKKWYIWLVEYFKKNGFEFIDYRKAIKELEKNNTNQNNKKSL